MDISKISNIEIAEICREYERAMDPKKQIQISSELHLLKPDMIRAILESKGYITPKAKKHSKTVFITYNGKTQNIPQWAEETGISKSAIRERYIKGWAPKDILTPTHNTTEQKEKYNHA